MARSTGDDDPLTVDEALTVPVPARRVWSALTVPAERARWWSYLDLDAARGGRFEETWTDDAGAVRVTRGQVIDVVPHRLLRLTWVDEGWAHDTEVRILLEESAAGTSVRVLHTGWERLPDGRALVAAHRAGWRMHLEDLRRAVEGGP